MKITRIFGGLATTALLASMFVVGTASSASAADSKDGNCPAAPKDRVIDIVYYIDGVPSTVLKAKAHSGAHVEARFDIDPDCTGPVEVSMVAYRTPSASFNPLTAHLHFVFDTDTGMFAPSTPESTPKHSLAVDLPDCFYEVDLVQGAVIETLGPKGSNNFYNAQGRYISDDTGGVAVCAETSPSTTTPPTTAPPSTTPPEVEGVVVTPAGTGTSGGSGAVAGNAAVQGEVLATTGTSSSYVLFLGAVAMLLLGGMAITYARRPHYFAAHRR